VFLLTLAAYAPNSASLWSYDDYGQVYGIYGNPIKSFAEGLSRSDNGLITPHRLLMYWFIGRGGSWGPTFAHVLALVIHIVCGLLFGALLWRLFRSPSLVVLSSAWFALAPWVSQPVLWWSAVCTMVSTFFILIAAHFFLTGFKELSLSHFAWLFMASLAAFIALCFYDLWVAGFLLFFGMVFSIALETDYSPWTALRRHAGYLAVMAVPFLLWGVSVAIIGLEGHPTGVLLTLDRLPIVLASIHLRVVNWFFGPDWLTLWKMGLEALTSPVSGLPFALGAILIVAAFATRATTPTHGVPVENSIPSPPLIAQRTCKACPGCRFPWSALFFAWMIFLASRLALVSWGAVSLQSRFNYGAGMAVALAAAATARWAWYRWCESSCLLRSAATFLTCGSILLMTLATAGQARHMALMSQAEAYTLAFLHRASATQPQCGITIVGAPVPNVGELKYGGGKPFRRKPNTEFLALSDCEVILRWSGMWPRAKLAPASLGG
jgi:hypothetical protein